VRVRELKADTLPVRESVILNVQLKTNGRYETKNRIRIAIFALGRWSPISPAQASMS